jgi:hypothetical protein
MKIKNIDVLNCINQMDNHLFLDKLNFKEGSGELHFYFWNKLCPKITNKDIQKLKKQKTRKRFKDSNNYWDVLRISSDK